MTQEQIAEQLQQAESEINKGNYAEAERLARKVLAIPLIEQEGLLKARAFHLISYSLCQRGIANKALPYAEVSLALAIQHKDRELEAMTLRNNGVGYYLLGNYKKSLEYSIKALVVFEELVDKFNIARVTMNIGAVYYDIGSYDEGLEYSTKALTTFEELGNKFYIARTIMNIGTAYSDIGNYYEALEYLSKALSINEELNNKPEVATVNMNIGSVYCGVGNYDKALKYLFKALSMHKQLGNKSGVTISTINIGDVYTNIGNYKKALEHYSKALILSEKINAKPTLVNIHESLARLYEIQNKSTEALMHFKKYHELKDQLLNEEAKKKAQQFDFERKQAEHEKQLAVERAKVAEKENILNNILPEEITARLIKGENPIADKIDNASVLFMDIVEFTQLSSRVSADQLVYLLNQIFTNCDSVMEEFGLEKIKTIGDSYMAVCGAPVPRKDHAERSAKAALKLVEVMKNLEIKLPDELGSTEWIKDIGEIGVRVGLHCGSMVAGVIGEKKFLYDLWGDAVNTASRMESHGVAGKIHISEEFKQAVETQCVVPLQFISRGELEIKGKGKMKTYFLEKA